MVGEIFCLNAVRTPLAARIGLIALAAQLSAASAFGGMITYTIDPTQSVLTASGSIGGISFQQQIIVQTGPYVTYESLVASFAGIITAQFDNGANTLQIESADVVAQDGGPYAAPWTGSATDQAPPANYGLDVNLFGVGGTTGSGIVPRLLGAIRGFAFSLYGPPENVSNGFDVSQLSVPITSGEFDYVDAAPTGYFPSDTYLASAISGVLSLASASGNLADASGVQTLTVPINTVLTVDATDPIILGAQTIPLDVSLSGTIVATAIVPEPARMGLLFAFALLARRGRIPRARVSSR